mgnify:CR=1 FL=1
MKIGIPKERHENEARVAISPDTIKKLRSENIDILIESGAGLGSSFSDDVFSEFGATILDTGRAVYEQADVVFKVRPPCQSEDLDEISMLKKVQIWRFYLGQVPFPQVLSFWRSEQLGRS